MNIDLAIYAAFLVVAFVVLAVIGDRAEVTLSTYMTLVDSNELAPALALVIFFVFFLGTIGWFAVDTCDGIRVLRSLMIAISVCAVNVALALTLVPVGLVIVCAITLVALVYITRLKNVPATAVVTILVPSILITILENFS